MSSDQLLEHVTSILQAMYDSNGAEVLEPTRALNELFDAQPYQITVLLAQIGSQDTPNSSSKIRTMALLSLNPLMYGQGLNPDPQRRFRDIYEFPLSVKEQEHIQQILCQSLVGDMDKELRKSIAICLANWIKGSCKLDEHYRPTSLSRYVMELLDSSVIEHRSSAFQILAHCPRLFIDSSNDGTLTSRLVSVGLIRGMTDPNNSTATRMEALKAVVEVMVCDGDVIHDDLSMRDTLFNAVYDFVIQLPWTLKAEGIKELNHLAEHQSGLFQIRGKALICFLLSVMSPAPLKTYKSGALARRRDYQVETSDRVAMQASELILTFIEAFPELFFGTASLDPLAVAYTTRILRSYMDVLINAVEDNLQKWSNEQPDEDDGDWGYISEALRRFALAASPYAKHARLSLKTAGNDLLKVPDWQSAYAVIVALSSMTEGCRPVMDPIVDYRWLRGLKKHSDPRVRHAWLEMTYQEAVHLKGDLQQWLFHELVADCVGLLQDGEARVRAQAARCLAGVFRPEAHRDLFIFRYSDLTHVVASLFITFDGGPLYVQQQVLKSLCAVAVCLGPSRLTPDIYRPWMDKLLVIMGPNGEHDNTALAIDNAITLVEVVAKKKDAESALSLSASYLPIITPIMVQYFSGLDELGKEFSIMLGCWLRLAVVLQESFSPVLPMVIPRLLVSASLPPIENANEVECYTEMEDKAEALTTLATYARAVPAGFFPYFRDTWESTTRSVQEEFPIVVKLAALHSVTDLVRLAKINGLANDRDSFEGLWGDIHVSVICSSALGSSDGLKVMEAGYKTLCDVLSLLGSVPDVRITTDVFEMAKERVSDMNNAREDRRSYESDQLPAYMDGYEELEVEEDKVLVEMDRACKMLSEVVNTEAWTREYEVLHQMIGELHVKYWKVQRDI